MTDPLITGIAISLVSYHLHKDPNKEYREVNPGIFVELREDWVIGAYSNSYGKNTALAARSFKMAQFGSVNMGGIVGVCTGYSVPVCGALHFKYKNLSVMVIPPVKKHSGVVAFAINI
jgi:hypothetical protein